jgi:vacuolar protein sorting-associated protein 35
VAPKYINSLVELIANGLESLERQQQQSAEEGGAAGAGNASFPHQGGNQQHHQVGAGLVNASSGLIWEGIQSVESCKRHFIALLRFIRDRKQAELRRLEAEQLIAKEKDASKSAPGPDWGAVNIAAAMAKMSM